KYPGHAFVAYRSDEDTYDGRAHKHRQSRSQVQDRHGRTLVRSYERRNKRGKGYIACQQSAPAHTGKHDHPEAVTPDGRGIIKEQGRQPAAYTAKPHNRIAPAQFVAHESKNQVEGDIR